MILIDMNQVMISNLMIHLTQNKEIDSGLVRHMVLNSLRSYRTRFYKNYGELVLCYDSKTYWRKKVFPYYKGTRKKDREKSPHNWASIFDTLNQLRDEFNEYLPYKVINVEGTEADDVIAAICKHQNLINIRLQKDMQPPVKVLILSGDKDFIQLQKYKFVSQYNPLQKKFVTGVDPQNYVSEHIIKGDRSDGIPNFLSDDDTLVENKRQKSITKKNIDQWVNMLPEEYCKNETELSNYKRNQQLIDFDFIPIEVEKNIIDSYECASTHKNNRMYEYFIHNNLTELLDKIGDF